MVLQKNQITDTYIWVHPDQYPLWARPDYTPSSPRCQS